MLAIVFTEDQYLRHTLPELLRKIGYNTVLVTDSIDEADYYFDEHQAKIDLICFESAPQYGSDAPLTRIIIKKEYLNLVPVVFISNHGRLSPFARNDPKNLSRIDFDLSRPFGVRQLKDAIRDAHQRRAQLRNKLLIVGTHENSRFIEAVYAHGSDLHWKEILFADGLEATKKHLASHPFRIGGILIDAGAYSPELLNFFTQYKRTIRGKYTPLSILRSDTSTGSEFRLIGDLFLDNNDWEDILTLVSHRLIYTAHSAETLQETKRLMKDKNYKAALHVIEAMLELDDERWEILEILGKLNELRGKKERAIACYKRSLELNPYNPAPYMSLVKLVDQNERPTIVHLGKAHCPHHPQIQQLGIHD